MKRSPAPAAQKVVTNASVQAASARRRIPGKYVVLTFVLFAAMSAVTAVVWPKPGPDAPVAMNSAERYAPLGDYLVDLAPDLQGRVAYLRLSLSIEPATPAALATIEAHRPAVDERISFFLRQLTPEDLDGSQAAARLKSELRRRIELAAGDGVVRDVIVSQLIVQ